MLKIPALDESLRNGYLAGKITACEVTLELAKANWFPYVPTEREALERIGVIK